MINWIGEGPASVYRVDITSGDELRWRHYCTGLAECVWCVWHHWILRQGVINVSIDGPEVMGKSPTKCVAVMFEATIRLAKEACMTKLGVKFHDEAL